MMFQLNAAAAATEPPLLAVVDPTGFLGGWLRDLCHSLRIELRMLNDATSLARSLEVDSPLAVVCGDPGDDGRVINRLLRLMSAYNSVTPILLVTGDDPETLGRVDAAVQLWPLQHIERLAGDVQVERVLDFLARAGRGSGHGGLVPIQSANSPNEAHLGA